MNAYILSIGAELLHGHITDTNATFLSQELDARGIELLHVVQVGDDRNRIRESIERALGGGRNRHLHGRHRPNRG